MTKIDIYSGFLGAGKTTLIKKLISDCYKGEKLVLIENEFGEIGIDGGFLQDSGIEISEMNSGCICCSLVGDFRTALSKVIDEFEPDRILIEPSGVGKLSDVIKAVESVADEKVLLNAFTTVVDAGKCKMYMKNFGEFFNDQIEHAGTIIMSHADTVKPDKLKTAVELVREKNPSAVIVTTPITELEPDVLVSAIERKDTLNAVLEAMHKEHEHHHEHHHHEHDEDCDCGCHDHHHEHHHHEHDEDCDCGCHDHHHEHHHHEHDEDCDCGCHEHHHEHHHHEHDEDCDCGCHEHHHEHHHEHDDDCDCGCHEHHHGHHHHHADEVFVSIGRETAKKFSSDEIKEILDMLCDEERFGIVLRAKGIVDSTEEKWIHFDYTPGEADVRHGSAGIIGRICVIGSKLNESAIEEAFGL